MSLHLWRSSMFLLALLSGFVLMGLAACSRHEMAPEPVRAVRVMTVKLAQTDNSREYAAELRPRVESRLGFRVAGKWVKRHVELGQRVQAGQLLAEIDPQDYQLAADAARAQVVAAQTQRDVAAADYKRFKDLREQSFISAADLERRETAFKTAQAQLDQAQLQSTAMGNQSAYTQLHADVSGVVTALEAEVGQVLAAGTPVIRLAHEGARDAVFAVPENEWASFKPGLPVRIRGWGRETSEADWSGRVREVAASADPLTRTYTVKAGFDWAAAAPPLGATVSVRPLWANASGKGMKLPTSALRQEAGQTAVWVLDSASMSVRSQNIQVAAVDGNEVVVSAGLKPGDVVVTAGVHVLSPGQKVALYAEKTEKSAEKSAEKNRPVGP